MPQERLIRLVSPEPSSLATCLDMFLLAQEAAHHTSKTLSYYRYTLGNFLSYLSARGVRSPEGVKATHIRAFLVSLQKQGYADTTVHGHARAIKALFSFLVKEEVLEASPMRKVTMPKLQQKILPPFSREDIEALLAACQGEFALRDQAIVLCLLDSGLRAAEFVDMNVGDVDRDGMVRVHGKGMKDRFVRLGAQARKALLKYLAKRKAKAGEPLWAGQQGRLTTSGLYQVVRRLGNRAGVKDCYTHRFRRTFAVWALRGGMNVHHLRAILGHADLNMALRYLALVKEDIAEAHKQASPVNHFLGKKRKR